MKCPRCQVDLAMSDRQGIEIDYCPQCRGVWLDRGELDKITERAARYSDEDAFAHSSERRDERRDDRRDERRDDRHDERRHHKRKSFWSELFD